MSIPQAWRDLEPAELMAKVEAMRKELFNLRIQQTLGRIENPARAKQVRRDIARLLTVFHERRIGGTVHHAAP